MLEQYCAYIKGLIILNIKRNDMIHESVWGIPCTIRLVIGLESEYCNSF
jgi:hypothetical protein